MELTGSDEDTETLPASKRHYGKYIGYVRDTADPEQLGRIRVFCPSVCGGNDIPESWLPWAIPVFPLGASNKVGTFLVPFSPKDFNLDLSSKNICVFIEFLEGDFRVPIYSGGFYKYQKQLGSLIPNVADADRGADASVGPIVGSVQINSVDVDSEGNFNSTTFTEPKPPGTPSYPDNRFIRMPSGSTVELDDTKGQERIKVFHASGTYWEMTRTGLVTKIQGKNNNVVTDADLKVVLGSSTDIFASTRKMQVDGDYTEILSGNRITHVKGTEKLKIYGGIEQTITGLYVVTAGNYEFNSSNNIFMTAAEGIAMGGREINMMGIEKTTIAGTATKILGLTGVNLVGTIPTVPPGSGSIVMGDELGKIWLAAQAVYDAFTKGSPENAIIPGTMAAIFTFMTTINAALNGKFPGGVLSTHAVTGA